MRSKDLKPGDPIPPCQEMPVVRKRDPAAVKELDGRLSKSEGMTSRGYVAHFLPDREVNIAALNKALADVYGEPALRGIRAEFEIDEEYWTQVCSDPWSGNIYRYNF